MAMVATFDELLAQARQAPRPFRDVTVVLDVDAAAEREALMVELEQTRKVNDARLSRKSTAEKIQEQIAEIESRETAGLVTLRVKKASGLEWNQATAKHPPDLESVMHLRYGYDAQTLTAEQGHRWITRQDGDEWVPFRFKSPSQGVAGVNEFKDFAEALSGHGFAAIVDAVFDLNVWEPQAKVERLKKALAARSTN